MIEQTILDYLSARLAVPVRMTAPEAPPERFCVLEKTGSGYDDGISAATLAVQSYGPAGPAQDGTLAAASLNEQVKAAMQEADTLPEVVSCTLSADYHFPDTTTRRPRYQAVFEVIHY